MLERDQTATTETRQTAGGQRRIRILLAEDSRNDTHLFELLSDTSEKRILPPVEVTRVEALDPALVELGHGPYDLFLLDLDLPESSGVETLERYEHAVDEQDPLHRLPVLLLTKGEHEDVALAAVERGAQGYLVKPEIDRRSVNQAVRCALERHEQKRRLRRQNERLETFANAVSHDFRNPLNIARGRLSLLRQECDSEHIETIEQSHARMEALVDDLLTLTRQGRTVETVAQAPLAKLANSAWNQVDTGRAALVCDVERSIEADPSRCKQLLENLFRNAVDHGAEDVTVRIGTLPGGFFVEDDGPGIPENNRNNVFTAGYTTHEFGTGLGLDVAREISEAHGWSVDLTEGTDGGARFEFTDVETDN